MRLDVKKLTPEARQALVDCLMIAARRGRLLRQARERAQVVQQPDLTYDSIESGIAQSASPDELGVDPDLVELNSTIPRSPKLASGETQNDNM
jgi:hypothetical protein